MKPKRLWSILLSLALLFSLCACKGEPEVWTIGPDAIEYWFDSTLPTESTPLVFTHLPVSYDDLGQVIPLGMAGSHVFPADHIYLAQSPRGTGENILPNATVYAPAAGKIHYIETPEETSSQYHDYSIRIAVSKNVTYVFGHIMMNSDDLQRLHVGDMVEAGDILGTFVSASNLDLLVLDRARGNFLDNDKYPITMLLAQNSLSYFTDDLRQQMYNKLLPPKPAGSHDDDMAVFQRHDPTLNGEHSSSYLYLINDSLNSTEEVFRAHYLDLRTGFSSIEGTFEFDRHDSIQGNWFSPLAAERWDEGISFYYDHWYPAQPRIRMRTAFSSIEGIDRFSLQLSLDGFVPFSEIGVGEEVVYVLFNENFCNWHGVPFENPIGLLRVRMEREDIIKVEAFAYNSSLQVEFTVNARYYYR